MSQRTQYWTPTYFPNILSKSRSPSSRPSLNVSPSVVLIQNHHSSLASVSAIYHLLTTFWCAQRSDTLFNYQTCYLLVVQTRFTLISADFFPRPSTCILPAIAIGRMADFCPQHYGQCIFLCDCVVACLALKMCIYLPAQCSTFISTFQSSTTSSCTVSESSCLLMWTFPDKGGVLWSYPDDLRAMCYPLSCQGAAAIQTDMTGQETLLLFTYSFI
jgi:hypothetical protein